MVALNNKNKLITFDNVTFFVEQKCSKKNEKQSDLFEIEQ